MPKIWSYSQFRSFLQDKALKIMIFLFGKSLELLIHKKIAMVGEFLDKEYIPKNLGFIIEK